MRKTVTSPLISVVIPTLDEAACLPAILADLYAQQGIELEIILVDGGSKDATCEMAVRYGVTLVSTMPGRGKQMNAGAAAARGKFFLFLHADSRLDDVFILRAACDFLEQAGERAGHKRLAGHFPLKFRRLLPGHDLAFCFLEEKSHLNRPNTTSGDQGFLLRRDFFMELGGFDETLPFLEDQKLAERIRAQGLWVTLPGCLQTSARRFEAEGFHRRYLLMGIIMGLHGAGVSAFFKRAITVYPTQQDTTRLLLSPYFSQIIAMLRHDLGLWGSVRAWFFVGRFIRQNSWQPFFFIDVICRPWLGAERYPFLRFHDCCVAPLISFSFFDALTGCLAFLWYMGVLAPCFWVLEWRERQGRGQV